MEMSVEHRIAASPQDVWDALNNTDILKAAIPGCDELESTSDTSFLAKVTTKIGPVKAKFKFEVDLDDLDPPNGYTINAQGQGGAAGFANGSAVVSLSEDGDETLLAYEAKAQVGGKLAQMGSRLIDGTAKKLADEFFTNFSAIVEAGGDTGEGETETEEGGAVGSPIPVNEAEKSDSSLPWKWIVLLLAGAGVLAMLLL